MPDKQILDEEGTNPGGRLDCDRGELPGRRPGAGRPGPGDRRRSGWKGLDSAPATVDAAGNAFVPAGVTVQQTLDLRSGEWDLSLQYGGGMDIRVSAPVPEPLAAGQPARVGDDVARRDVALRRRCHHDLRHRRGQSPRSAAPNGAALGPIVATRRGGEREVAAGAACGRFVDGYVVG